MSEGEKALLQCHPLLTLPILILGLPDQAPPHPKEESKPNTRQALSLPFQALQIYTGDSRRAHSGPERPPNQSTSFPV